MLHLLLTRALSEEGKEQCCQHLRRVTGSETGQKNLSLNDVHLIKPKNKNKNTHKAHSLNFCYTLEDIYRHLLQPNHHDQEHKVMMELEETDRRRHISFTASLHKRIAGHD